MEKGIIPLTDRVASLVEDFDVDDGSRLSILRRRLKLTLRDVAQATGIPEYQLSEMERGTRKVDPKYVTLIDQRSKTKK